MMTLTKIMMISRRWKTLFKIRKLLDNLCKRRSRTIKVAHLARRINLSNAREGRQLIAIHRQIMTVKSMSQLLMEKRSVYWSVELAISSGPLVPSTAVTAAPVLRFTIITVPGWELASASAIIDISSYSLYWPQCTQYTLYSSMWCSRKKSYMVKRMMISGTSITLWALPYWSSAAW